MHCIGQTGKAVFSTAAKSGPQTGILELGKSVPLRWPRGVWGENLRDD